jgi:hypothetical protein
MAGLGVARPGEARIGQARAVISGESVHRAGFPVAIVINGYGRAMRAGMW